MHNLPWQLLLQLYEVLPQNPKKQNKEISFKIFLNYTYY